MDDSLPTMDIYSLENLQKAWKDGKRFTFIYFWGFEKEDVYLEPTETCLTQWYPSEFVDEKGNHFSCCEQYMMAKKAELFGDKEILEKILATNNPDEIKRLGRLVKNFDQEIWDKNCQEIVFQANLYKFSQNENLQNYLLSQSFDAIFVEASPYDAIWGIKLPILKAKTVSPLQWKGKNFLGFQLTRVRDQLILQNS
ncbi:hypothetical protein M9Y10_001636 [Tritrichomonas musculus]|uniref:NADAR domain-containing protein n=1 Tax=Tritrichomonas musculus TaxID=1915356 RepID=A0ABR2L7Y3_9EUKA